MPTALNAIKNHVSNHCIKYTVAVAAIVAAKKAVRVAGEWKEFADEHGVTEALKSPSENHV